MRKQVLSSDDRRAQVSWRGCLSLIALALTVFPAADGKALPKPNILCIITDDQRPDTVHALGNPHIRTPNLDRLVQSGVSFTRAIAAFPLCVPSRAEILTGASSFRNGVPYGGGRLKNDVAFWGDTLRAAGYHTWYTGKWMNDGQPKTRGYEETRGLFTAGGAGEKGKLDRYGRMGRLITGYRGWTFKTDDGKVELEKGIGLTAKTSRYIGDAAVELINRKPGKPFFLHVNFTAPHDPLIFPPGYEGKYDPAKLPLPANFLSEHPFDHGSLRSRDEQLLPWPRTPADIRSELAVYYAVIEDMDAQVGRMLQALQANGQLDNTVIIFSSDHGLALGSHGLMGKQNMYEHTIGVPFIIGGPGIPKNRRTAAQCYLRDLFPTACELAGVRVPASVQGRSLVPVLTGRADAVYPFVTAYFADFQRMIRTDDWKLIFYPHLNKYQLFDLKRDPSELKDLSAEPVQAPRLAELRAQMEGWFREQGDPLFVKPAGVVFQDDFKGKLDNGWSWVREHREAWRVTDRGLEVRIEPGNMWGKANNARNVLVRPVPAPGTNTIEVSVTVENRPTAQYEQADLVWYYDDSHMVKIGQELVNGQLSIVMGREENDRTRTVTIIPLKSDSVRLRHLVTGNRIRGQFRTPEMKDWQDAGECDLPAQGEPKVSLQFYQGPADAEHWAKVTEFRIGRRLRATQ